LLLSSVPLRFPFELRSGDMGGAIDALAITPTILELLGVKPPAGMQGGALARR
jgi:hypothetical protein